MDWRLFVATFVSVFVAELGDKTQLTTVAIAGSTDARWTIFAGSAAALVASAGVAVFAADWIARIVTPDTLRQCSGVLFLGFGIWFLAGRPG